MEELLQETDKPTGLPPIPRSITKLWGLHLYRAWPFLPWLISHLTIQVVPEPQDVPACVFRLAAAVCQRLPANSSVLNATSKRTRMDAGWDTGGRKQTFCFCTSGPMWQDLPCIPAPKAGVKGTQKPLRNGHSYWVGSAAFSKSNNKLPRLFHYLPFYKIFMFYYYHCFWKASRWPFVYITTHIHLIRHKFFRGKGKGR